MKLSTRELQYPAARGVRLVALNLLDEAGESAARLVASVGADNLHDFRVAVRRLRSWIRVLRDRLPDAGKSDRKRLKQCAKATNEGRDLEVQIAWLEKSSSRFNLRRKRGTQWLAGELKARQPDMEKLVTVAIEKNLTPARASLSSRLETYMQPVRPDPPGMETLACAIADRLLPITRALTASLDRITDLADEREIHQARIRTKRVRYLLEPAASSAKGGSKAIAKLRSLQDSLGNVHDLQLLAHVIEQMVERSAGLNTPRTDLLSVARHLQHDVEKSFKPVRENWLDGKHAAFSDLIEGIASRLMKFG